VTTKKNIDFEKAIKREFHKTYLLIRKAKAKRYNDAFNKWLNNNNNKIGK